LQPKLFSSTFLFMFIVVVLWDFSSVDVVYCFYVAFFGSYEKKKIYSILYTWQSFDNTHTLAKIHMTTFYSQLQRKGGLPPFFFSKNSFHIWWIHKKRGFLLFEPNFSLKKDIHSHTYKRPSSSSAAKSNLWSFMRTCWYALTFQKFYRIFQ
jgi:hypothetical protein